MRTENLLSLLLLALLKCHIGYAGYGMKCNSCIGDCKNNEVKTCNPEEVCMIREMYQNGVRQGQQKGCLHAQLCNSTSEVEGFKQWCCNTDMCNTEMPQPGGAIPGRAPELTCYHCGYICIHKESMVCPENQVCVIKSTTIAAVPLKSYGCANSTICSTYTSEDVAGSRVSVKNDCCTSNLCNSAAALRLPLLAAIGALLFLWVVKLS